MNLTPELQKIDKRMAEHEAAEHAGGNADRRIASATGRKSWAGQVLPVIQATLRGIEEDFGRQYDNWFGSRPKTHEPFELDDQVRTAHTYNAAGIGAVAVEIVLSIWLLFSSVHLSFLMAVAVGVSFSLSLSYAAKSAFSAIRGRLADTPTVARDRIGRAARWLLAISCAALVVFLLGRGASGILAMAVIVTLPVSLAVLSITLPLLAGACLVAADILSWSRRLTTLWHGAKLLEGRVASLGSDRDQDHNDRPIQRPRSATLVGAGLVFLAMTIGVQAQASQLPLTSRTLQAEQAVPAPTQATPAREPQGQLFVDTSGSRSTDIYLGLVPDLLSRIDAMAMDGVSTWRVVPFVDRGFYALGKPFRLAAFKSPPCGPRQVVSEAEAMFESVRKEMDRRALDECNTQRITAEQKHRDARSAELRAFEQEMRAVGANQPGSCSGILDVLNRVALTSPGVAVIVTDGLENCQALSPVARPSHDIRVYLILIPAKGAAGQLGLEFAKRSAAIRSVAPWLVVLAPFQMDDIR